jgi:hypothetical protein
MGNNALFMLWWALGEERRAGAGGERPVWEFSGGLSTILFIRELPIRPSAVSVRKMQKLVLSILCIVAVASAAPLGTREEGCICLRTPNRHHVAHFFFLLRSLMSDGPIFHVANKNQISASGISAGAYVGEIQSDLRPFSSLLFDGLRLPIVRMLMLCYHDIVSLLLKCM